MDSSNDVLEQKSKLYQAAMRVKELAPWHWMHESDLFGVQNPETEEIGFVSVMGELGEHVAIALYLGVDGLDGFWRIYSSGADYPEAILEVPQLQASFEDRRDLTLEDREEIEDLGLEFHDRKAWPLFRSIRPGHYPWFLEPQEAQFLIWALEQVMVVAPRVRENPDLLMAEDTETYLVRAAEESEGGLLWEDRVMEIPESEPDFISITMDRQLLRRLKRLPQKGITMEIDLFLFPAKIGKEGERPRCAYALMVVDGKRGFVLRNEILEPQPTFKDMYGEVPLVVADLLAETELIPTTVKVRSELLQRLLKPLTGELGIRLKWGSSLPYLDAAKDFLFRQFG